ncbi:hypothetical protein P691DRAFT_783416 [Macrolepiota fuliginosa MF-IS2]|uniref:Uncharacterized protein n=1 Tax=Macrolepiota fuliginosa MF-IS2 TaxID=1400762 RepID=A0A9P6C2P3_9AGAR|nr:hypothetical protein P691DRAFT_783416 [Macrolepiota fuliginosa MF-IS2]
MSIPTSSPTTPTTDRQKLEPLQELKLKGFGSCQDTPTSKTASLPTPSGASVPLADSADMVNAQPLGENLDDWNDQYSRFDHIATRAPLLKDLDSFTEGSDDGSFDSIPAAETDQHGNPIYSLSEAYVQRVPPRYDTTAHILDWLRAQAESTPILDIPDLAIPTLKRPRSMSEYEEYRPRRPRTRSCPSSRRSNSMAPD